MQNQSYPHEVLPDPSGRFILVPDLGTDTVRIFAIAKHLIMGPIQNELLIREPLKLAPGTGPRHGEFAVVGNETYFYIAGQISNMIHQYQVIYSRDGKIEFKPIGVVDTRVRLDGSVIDAPDGTSGLHDSEVQISVRHLSL